MVDTAMICFIGGNANDSLEGDRGEDVLIGGAGEDALNGGKENDLLIAGTTTYDNDSSALEEIFAEWSRDDINFNTRVANLRNGDTPNGVRLEGGVTLFDDDTPDWLSGKQDRDWFWAEQDGQDGDDDTIRDLRAEDLLDALLPPIP